jgi:hypothetical protein
MLGLFGYDVRCVLHLITASNRPASQQAMRSEVSKASSLQASSPYGQEAIRGQQASRRSGRQVVRPASQEATRPTSQEATRPAGQKANRLSGQQTSGLTGHWPHND